MKRKYWLILTIAIIVITSAILGLKPMYYVGYALGWLASVVVSLFS